MADEEGPAAANTVRTSDDQRWPDAVKEKLGMTIEFCRQGIGAAGFGGKLIVRSDGSENLMARCEERWWD